MKESQLQLAMVHELRAYGFAVVRINSAKRKTDAGHWMSAYHIYGLGKDAAKGFPDLVAFKDNRMLLVEVKKPGGKLRTSQEKAKAHFESCGNSYFVVDSLKDLQNIISNFMI